VSPQVLAAVTRALRLDGRAPRHAFALAAPEPPSSPPAAPGTALTGSPARDRDRLARQIAPVLDRPSPAALLDEHLDILIPNDAFASTWGADGNLVVLLAGRGVLQQPLAQVLRAQADRFPGPRFDEIYATLNAEHPDLAHWWSCRGAAEHGSIEGDGFRFTLLRPVEVPEWLVIL
jgi:hypothetical protein